MRILHLADRLTDRGGAHIHLRGILEALGARGHTVRLLVGTRSGTVAAPCETLLLPGLEARERVAVPLERAVSEFGPDLVHVHTVVNPAVLESLGRWRGVITVQDHRYFCPSRGKWTAAGVVCTQAMAASVCRACFDDDGYAAQILDLTQARLRALRTLTVVVLSRYMRDELVAVGVGAQRLHVIPPFVHALDPDATPAGPPCVLFVGRLAESKGPLEALAAWRRSGVELPLLFAGTGPLRPALEASGATVLGWVDRSDCRACCAARGRS